MSEQFTVWLTAELERRGWSREQLSNRAGIHSSVLANVYSGRAAVGPETAKKVAAALDISAITVFRLAGILPNEEEVDDIFEKLRFEFNQLERPEDQESIIRLVRAYRVALEEDRARSRDGATKARKTAKGSA